MQGRSTQSSGRNRQVDDREAVEERYRLDTQIWLTALLATLFASVCATGAWARGWLNRDGALAAFLLGWLVYFAGTWGASFTLLFFFVTASAWSALAEGSGPGSGLDHNAGPNPDTVASPDHGAAAGDGPAPARHQKPVRNPRPARDPSPALKPSPRRNARQVLANGLVAALACLAGHIARTLSPSLTRPDLVAVAAWVAFTAALAEATADTWASELGRRFGGRPRRLTDFRPVPPGTSGAISPVGTLAALAGASLLTLVSVELALAGLFPFLPAPAFAIVAGKAAVSASVSGFAGTLVDSWLGSRWQAVYHCDHCGVDTEKAFHRCGKSARLYRGLHWLDNDMVNLLSTVFATVLGLVSVFPFFTKL
ncbi:MAG: DUF92 domain-containing protein [Limnochordales bacterium]|nr:DUF92 domain-containing protein [Limnochordales bacterium]